ncbi:RtcB family protein [Puniceicoccaceae bacterium K14]|nr:RtcB family protein [Puniceicoccaceae bacterium K14]
MNTQDLAKIGIPLGAPMKAAMDLLKTSFQNGDSSETVTQLLQSIVSSPESHTNTIGAELARLLSSKLFVPRDAPAPYRQWGDDLEEKSIQQMLNGCNLPIAEQGALMPDAHPGYGLPIGGVLATNNAVIPYAVGVDIACRVKLSVYDISVERLLQDQGKGSFTNSLHRETQFGIGAHFRDKRQHSVMDLNWDISPITKKFKDKAWKQLGTSGSGNHFVEFGEIELTDDSLGVAPGKYVALMSHSGSRGTGAAVAAHYSKLAQSQHPELPKELQHLAWLDLDLADGQEYWAAMELMGEYAAANHACIHRHIAKDLGLEVILDVENHHNFAWKEVHNGKEVVVHRKGATPAGEGVLGVIPGSMASPAYVVRGKGEPSSLNSAAHGAGRVMSRKKASTTLNWNDARNLLTERGVTLLSAGLDEVPFVYKDIDEVMGAQSDLVDPVARFFPRLVKMAKAGERPED